MSNNFAGILDELMKIQKKSKASQEKRAAFDYNWLKLVQTEGFTERAENYLYNGLAFCGAEPLMQYISQSVNKDEIMHSLFNGKMYDKNNEVTFRLLTHILAISLNEGSNLKMISAIIEKLPKVLQNKEGKRLGNADQIMEKYFFKLLDLKNDLPPLHDLEIEESSVKDFIKLIKSCILNIKDRESVKNRVIININKIESWIENYEKSNEIIKTPNVSIIRNNDKNLDKKLSLTENLYNITKMAEEVEAENLKYKEDNIKLCQQLSDEQNKILTLQQQMDEMKQKFAECKNDIASKDEIINDYIKKIDILEREQAYKINAALQRIASQLKIEYQDFEDALNLPISCDLGENFRLQLSNIFKILKEGGLKFD